MQYPDPSIEFCLEGSSSIFKGLNQKDKETIIQHHSKSVLKKGTLIVEEGTKPCGLIYLVSGKMKVFNIGVGGREQILKMAGPGCIIGYSALFSDNTWTFSAVALEDSVVCILDKNSLINIMKKNGPFALKYIKLLTEELGYSNRRTVSLTQKHVRGRLAESLLLLGNTYGFEDDGKTIGVLLSREDIAHLSNMTTSNAIRILSGLAREGIIKIKGRRITILNTDNLVHISETG